QPLNFSAWLFGMLVLSALATILWVAVNRLNRPRLPAPKLTIVGFAVGYEADPEINKIIQLGIPAHSATVEEPFKHGAWRLYRNSIHHNVLTTDLSLGYGAPNQLVQLARNSVGGWSVTRRHSIALDYPMVMATSADNNVTALMITKDITPAGVIEFMI